MSKTAIPVLDVGDIQATVLRPRPSPYKGEYVSTSYRRCGSGAGDVAPDYPPCGTGGRMVGT